MEEAGKEEKIEEDDLHFSVCFRPRVSMKRANDVSLISKAMWVTPEITNLYLSGLLCLL